MPRSRAVDEKVKSAAANPSPLAGQGREGARGAGVQALGLGRSVCAEINSARLSSTPSPPTPDSSPPGGGEQALRHVHRALPHDSAAKHVQGAAEYIDDIREPEGTLHVAVGQSPKARGRIAALELGEVRAGPGVVAVLTASEIPGKNDVSPAFGDDPLFAVDEVSFRGQALFAVVALTRAAARRAARLAAVEIEGEAPSVMIEDARARGETVLPDYAFGHGDAAAAIAAAPHRLEGSFRVGGQEHFYLEGQVALAVPGEDGA